MRHGVNAEKAHQRQKEGRGGNLKTSNIPLKYEGGKKAFGFYGNGAYGASAWEIYQRKRPFPVREANELEDNYRALYPSFPQLDAVVNTPHDFCKCSDCLQPPGWVLEKEKEAGAWTQVHKHFWACVCPGVGGQSRGGSGLILHCKI